MSILVDARGRSCPEPVMMAKQALDQANGQDLEILVSSQTALDNIERFINKEGLQTSSEKKDQDFIIRVKG